MHKFSSQHEQIFQYLAAPYSALSRCLEALDLNPRPRSARRWLSRRAGSVEITIVRHLPLGGHGHYKLIYFMITIMVNIIIILIGRGGEAMQKYLRTGLDRAGSLALALVTDGIKTDASHANSAIIPLVIVFLRAMHVNRTIN